MNLLNKILALISVFLLFTLLAGCGQKGPLYLPKQNSNVSVNLIQK